MPAPEDSKETTNESDNHEYFAKYDMKVGFSYL